MFNVRYVLIINRYRARVAVGAALLAAGCAQLDSPQGFSAAYACENGQRFTVHFEHAIATVTLWNMPPIRLTQQRAPSGMHYTNDGYELRGKGDDATWTTPQQRTVQCKSV